MDLWELGVRSIKQLETEHGILASSRAEIYGCIFGRDSLITALKLLKIYEKKRDPYFLNLVGKILRNLALLQGIEVNRESGEEPGKCIHEWRPTGHEHLTKLAESPWYLYPDNVMRNYDSIDATPLFLIAVYEYWRITRDETFVLSMQHSVEQSLRWLLEYGDKNGDGLMDYEFHSERIYGGLRTQSWMDSAESVFFEHDTTTPKYPIAPVEVQAYAYAALCAWSEFYATRDVLRSLKLSSRALELRRLFNERYVLKNRRTGYSRVAFAIDGEGRAMISPRSSMGHCLWAIARSESTSRSILDDRYIPGLVERLMARDMFVSRAGIRTLSSRSKNFDPLSYHNGTIWPHDTALLAEGFENFGYHKEAQQIREALRSAYKHFATPIELFGYSKGRFKEYKHANGTGGACRIQAWSAAALLSSVEDANSRNSVHEPL